MEDSSRSRKLWRVAAWLLAILFAKVLVSILLEYRWYFPADFDASSFLRNRQDSFVGNYRVAFYVHIIGSPIAALLGSLLFATGGRKSFSKAHRLGGRILLLMVLLVVAPSGLVMARQAYAGPIAALGFASLSISTAVASLVAVHFARTKRFRSHQQWATRSLILLLSPLVLRVASGAMITMQVESDWTYRLNAWLSWLVPLAIYEAWRRWSASRNVSPSRDNIRGTEEGFP